MPSQDGAAVSPAEAAYDALRARIVQVRIVPGSPLDESGAADALGTGRTAVRHALARLASDGLLTGSRDEGYRVAPLTVAGVHGLFVIWTDVGAEILGRAAEDLDEVRLGSLLDAVRERDRFDAARGLWVGLVEALGDDDLRREYRRLATPLERAHALASASAPDRIRPVTVLDLADLLRRRDAAALRAAFTAYTADLHRVVVDVLSALPLSQQDGEP